MPKLSAIKFIRGQIGVGSNDYPVSNIRVLFAIILVGINLRPLYTSVGSTLEAIRLELDLTSAQLGLLTTLPSLCMGAVAIGAGMLLNTVPLSQGIRLSLAIIGLGSGLRLFADGLGILALSSFIGGVGIATAQVFVPVVIKHRFANRAATVTAGYAAFMNLGASIAAATTPWIVGVLGGWRSGLAIWLLPALIAAVAWPSNIGLAAQNEPRARLPWRRPVARRLTVFLIASSGIYGTMLAWTAPIYETLGWSTTRAGLLLAVLTSAQVAGSLATLPLTWWSRDRRWGMGIAVLSLLIGLSGILLAPEIAPWSWMVLIGGGLGAAFPLALVLPMDYCTSPVETGGLTAMVFGVGVLIGGFTPWWIGLLRDLSGDFQSGILALIFLACVKLLLTFTFHPNAR